MRTLFIQTLRELRSIFHTPVAYVVMFLFVGLIGFNFLLAVLQLNGKDVDLSLAEETFISGPFIFLFMIATALITMRSFSEEYRMGTIETLTTAPIQDWQVVLSKFFGAVIFYVILFLPSVAFFWIFKLMSGELGARSASAIGSTYLILILIGMFFVSFGLFASSLVRDQINAALITLIASILYLFLPSTLSILVGATSPALQRATEFLSPLEHIYDFARGFVDTRRIVWYVSLSVFFIVLTSHVFHSRKLRQ
jgi:ABC-2 type transport system permease protein